MDLIDRLLDVSKLEDIDHDICDTAGEAAREIAELRQVIIRIKAEACQHLAVVIGGATCHDIQVAYEWASRLAD